MTELKLPKGDWVEITGEDWEDHSLVDGTEFEHAIEIRSWDVDGGYWAHYYAVLDE